MEQRWTERKKKACLNVYIVNGY